ncbi:MAG: hypothetical protein WD906_00865 [Anaerolineales bacterium]
MSPLIEIRSYKLLPGTSAEFDRLVAEQSVPMLRPRNVDGVAYGPSAGGEDMYYLIRADSSLEALEASEDDVYGSGEWRQGPWEAILERIDTYSSIVLEVSEAPVQGLRR